MCIRDRFTVQTNRRSNITQIEYDVKELHQLQGKPLSREAGTVPLNLVHDGVKYTVDEIVNSEGRNEYILLIDGRNLYENIYVTPDYSPSTAKK